MAYASIERGLAGRVTEVGTPAPRVKPISKGQKASGTLADVGLGVLAAAPFVAMAIPGLQPVALAGLAATSAVGVGLGSKARSNFKDKKMDAINATAGQNANESTEPRN